MIIDVIIYKGIKIIGFFDLLFLDKDFQKKVASSSLLDPKKKKNLLDKIKE